MHVVRWLISGHAVVIDVAMSSANILLHPDVVIFACGNLSRGDDAIGPLLIERLEEKLQAQALAQCFELIYDYQFQIEHALDLEQRKLALFIDASVSSKAPFEFYRAQASTDVAHTSHMLSPEAVLGVWQKIQKVEAPASFVLSVRGESFELGESLSQGASHNLEEAFVFLLELCQRPLLEEWQSKATCYTKCV